MHNQTIKRGLAWLLAALLFVFTVPAAFATEGSGENTGTSSVIETQQESSSDLPASSEEESSSNLPTSSEGESSSNLPTSSEGESSSNLPTSSEGDGSSDLPTSSEGDGSSDLPTSSEGDSSSDLPTSSEGDGSSEEGGSSDLPTSSEGDGSSEESSSEPPASSQPVLKLKSWNVYNTKNNKSIKQYFYLNKNFLEGMVPKSIESISITATSNFGTCTITYHKSILVEGENKKYAVITVTDGIQTVSYTVNVLRESDFFPGYEDEDPSSEVPPSSEESVSSEAESLPPITSTESMEPPSSSLQDPTESEDENKDDGEWMVPIALLLLVLGAAGLIFIVCDILYTRGVLKKRNGSKKQQKGKRTVPQNHLNAEAARELQEFERSWKQTEAEKKKEKNRAESWDDFFKD